MTQFDCCIYLLEYKEVIDKDEEIRLLGREKVKIGWCFYKNVYKQETNGFTVKAYWNIKTDVTSIKKYLFVLLMFCIKRHFVIVMNCCPIHFFTDNYSKVSLLEFRNIAEWLGLH